MEKAVLECILPTATREALGRENFFAEKASDSRIEKDKRLPVTLRKKGGGR